MALNQQYPLVDYGLTNALQTVFPVPIVSNRAPTTADKAQIGMLWVQPVNTSGVAQNAVWVLTSIISNVANWANLSGGSASFNNIALPYTTATVGRITHGGILSISVPETTSIFLGQAAGNVTYTGNHNVGVGELSLSSLTTGSANAAVGFNAGQNITTGNNNVLMGSGAGNALTTGSSNVALGEAALVASTTSSDNIAIGHGALLGVTTGTGQNIAIGGNSVLGGITTGAANIAIGYGAGSALVTGTEAGNIYINDAGVNGESNMMRLTSNGGVKISAAGSTNTLELFSNGLVQVDAVLSVIASPTAAWTSNQRVVRGRFTGFTTASTATQAFTLTSNQITTATSILVTVANLDASGNHAQMTLQSVIISANTAVINTKNNGAGALGAGDDVLVTVWVID